MYSVKDKIIVLRTIKYGEADLVIHGLNPLGGRLNFMAKSARKSRRRFGGGVLEPTHYIEVTYKRRSSEEGEALHFLEDARLIEGFAKLRTDYQRLEAGLYFVQLMARVTHEGVMDSPEGFLLLGGALRAAETSGDLAKLRLHFELRLLHQQGVLPHDMPTHDLLEHSIKEHELTRARPEELMALRAQVAHVLAQYLGLP